MLMPFTIPKKLIRKHFTDPSGQGMSEYLILILLIAVVSISAAREIGTTLFHKFEQVNRSLETVRIEDGRGTTAAQVTPH